MTSTKHVEREYAKLLVDALPHVPKDDDDDETLAERMRLLIVKGEKRSKAEDRLMELLGVLTETYEAEHVEVPDAAPHEVLAFLLEKHGKRAVELEGIFGSRGHISDVLMGRRGFTPEKARELGAFFNVDWTVFV